MAAGEVIQIGSGCDGHFGRQRERGATGGSGSNSVDDDEAALFTLLKVRKVARLQNLIPSFPWIAPGWRAWGHRVEGVGAQSKERKGSYFVA